MASWTNKQKRFVAEYPVDCNATQAAIRAGYSERTARQSASRLMKDPDIQEAISERLEELSMSAAEATKRMSDIAQGDIAACYTIIEEGDERYAKLDLVKLLEGPYSHLVKKIKWTKHGPSVEMYDAQDAIETIMKAHGKFGPDGSEDDPVHVKMLTWTDEEDDSE